MTSFQILAKADHGGVSKSITRTLDFEESDTLNFEQSDTDCKFLPQVHEWPTAKRQCVGKMASIAYAACIRSQSQLTIHVLGPFGGPPEKVLYPFLRLAFHSADHAGRWWSSPHRSHFSCLPSE